MPKRKLLVCQHLENVSRELLEQNPKIVREYVRHRQGIYALYRRSKIYYVGLAGNLRSRLGHHLKDRHHDSWDRFSVYRSTDIFRPARYRDTEAYGQNVDIRGGGHGHGHGQPTDGCGRGCGHGPEAGMARLWTGHDPGSAPD